MVNLTYRDWLAEAPHGARPPRPAPRWLRLPLVRHVRTFWLFHRVARWYRDGPGSIGIPTGYDDWVLRGIWNGFV